MKKKKALISLFTGMGGLDFGFEAAGFQTRVAVEIDRTCCNTIRANRNWKLIEGDIHKISSSAILKAGNLKVGEADILIGGPPCQPFSKSSYWVEGGAARLDDDRSKSLIAFLRVLRDTKPKSFLLENVKGIAFVEKDEGLQLLLKGISKINKDLKTDYQVSWASLNAAEFGVPQIRERVFLIGSRKGIKFIFPKPTHREITKNSKYLLPSEKLLPFKTAWDAIGNLPDPREPGVVTGGKWADLLPSVPEGENYLWHTPRGGGQPLFGWRTRYWNFLLKLKKDLPSWTIQSTPGSASGPFHWNNRKLSSKEMCRLQTFPEGIKFECSRTQIQKMTGNAVPSLMAEILGNEILKQFFGEKRGRKYLLMPRKSRYTPRVKRRERVPEKYLSMIGNHLDHPGEGMGPSASKF